MKIQIDGMAVKKSSRSARTARKPRKGGSRGWLRRHAIALTTVCVAAVVAAAVALWIGLWPYTGSARWVHIPAEATRSQVTDSLKSALGSSMGSRVAMLWRLQGGRPGTARGAYLVNPGSTAFSLSRAVATGRQTPVKVKFRGVRTIDRLYEALASQLEVTPEQIRAAADSVLPEMGFVRPEQYPAAFIPDTYEFYWTVSAPDLVRRLARYRSDFWTAPRLEAAKRLGLNPVEVATIASIIEEETAKADERPKVARLYINRLHKGMRLQADPTVKFAVGDFSLRRIGAKHLRTPSPYNTYLNAGLPPGPIRVPERSALIDVLEAPGHPYLFMCAKSDFSGYHDFAVDYATHQANARRYQQELNKRNIH